MKLALQRDELDMAFRTFTPTENASLETTKGIKVWKRDLGSRSAIWSST